MTLKIATATPATKTDPVYDAIAAKHQALRDLWLKPLTQQQRDDLRNAFPSCDSGLIPVGEHVLLQMKRPRIKSASGRIVLVAETKDAERWNEQIGLVVSMGPLAYRKRTDTAEWWQEGPWCVVGDYVRIPKFGFDRFEIPLEGGDQGETIIFCTVSDKNVLGVQTCNPLTVKSYI